LPPLANETAVIAPYFQASTDDPPPQPGELCFRPESPGSWKDGGKTTCTSPTKAFNATSFDVIEHILNGLTSRTNFPNLKEIVVTGHSAGGQLTQRWAMQSVRPKPAEYRYRIVPANPSSYAYLSGVRPAQDSPNKFEEPSKNPNRPANCTSTAPGYNTWKYGLEGRPRTMGGDGPTRQLYVSAPVTLLLGQADTRTDESGFDNGCAANLQGVNRYTRGGWFWYYMQRFYGAHDRKEVPFVGHSGEEMYMSDVGRAVLFR
jgi:hypothetical protein